MKKNILIIGLFIGLIITMTFPLVFKVFTHLPAFFSTDEIYGTVWDSWRIHHSAANHYNLKGTDFIAYPFGVNLFSSGYAAYSYLAVLYSLSLFTTPVLTYNLQILSNFLLSLTIAYFLILYLTRNKAGAILGAIAFGFCSYQFARTWQHISLTYNYLIPLSCFAMIDFREKPFRKQAFLMFLAVILTFTMDYTIAYFTLISLTAFFVYSILFNWRNKFTAKEGLPQNEYLFIKKTVIIGMLSAIILLPQFFPLIKNRIKPSNDNPAAAVNPFHRPFEDLFEQSAKPLSYFLPAPTHPLFGKFTEQFVGSQLYGVSFTEHVLYLGWAPLILAFVAFRRWRRGVGTPPYRSGGCPAFCSRTVPFADNFSERDNFYIGFFVFLAIAAWLFSQPPWWKLGPLRIYMPSFFMYKILPMYRAYCRFGIVVMLAVAVLAGFGLKFTLERYKNKIVKISLAGLLIGLALFEFWNYPPYKVIDVSRFPAVYDWLRGEPKDIVIAEYPLDARDPNEFYKLFQTRHQKKMINATARWTYANKVAQGIVQLSDPDTAGILKWLEVKYVLVHQRRYLDTELIELKEELSKIPFNQGLKLIKSFSAQECPQEGIMCIQKTGPIDVYEVVAQPLNPKE